MENAETKMFSWSSTIMVPWEQAVERIQNWKKVVLILLLVCIPIYSHEYVMSTSIHASNYKMPDQIQNEKDAMEFMFAIAMRESGVLCNNTPPNPSSTNKFGYRGLFQFGHSALKEVGYDSVTLVKFKKNPDIWPISNQYDAMYKLLRSNHKHLSWYIKHYSGRKIKNITITEAGILAGAHLLGWDRVKQYIKSNGEYNPRDGFKTSMEDYLRLFSNYKCPMEKLDSGFYDVGYHQMLCDKVKSGEWSYNK